MKIFKMNNLPKKIPVFPLSNFIIFPKTTVPLNIFEPRYIDMINDCMKSDKLIGMIQPKIQKNENFDAPELYKIGCMGKIINSQKTDDGRYLIELKGLIRFNIVSEIVSKMDCNFYIVVSNILHAHYKNFEVLEY